MTQNGASSLSLNLGALSHSATSGGSMDINLPTTGTVSATSTTSTGGLIVDGTGSAYVTVNNGADWAAINGANVVAGASVAGFYTSSASGLAGNADILSNPTLSTSTAVTSIRQNDTSAHTIDLGGTNTLTTGGILITPTAGGCFNHSEWYVDRRWHQRRDCSGKSEQHKFSSYHQCGDRQQRRRNHGTDQEWRRHLGFER